VPSRKETAPGRRGQSCKEDGVILAVPMGKKAAEVTQADRLFPEGRRYLVTLHCAQLAKEHLSTHSRPWEFPTQHQDVKIQAAVHTWKSCH
jgi:hypothetical protein